jgi:hypothetical protein
MITAIQKLKISRLSILSIFLPGTSNALTQIATIRREKQDRNDRRFVPIAFRIWRPACFGQGRSNAASGAGRDVDAPLSSAPVA